jgi:Ca-activated chloride channel family protein
MTTTATKMNPGASSAGGRLVAVDGRSLPLLGVRIGASARGGLARTVLEQRFRNPFSEPLHLRYVFALPHGGAVSGFAFRIGEERVVGEVDTLASARERYEVALVSGRSAARVEQARSSVFEQELGNVPPGAEVVSELVIDQRLAWREDGWEYRFPAAVAPRFQGATAQAEARIDVAVSAAPMAPRLAFSLAVGDPLAGGAALTSPSHRIVAQRVDGALAATLAEEGGAPLDRDVVIRWRAAAAEVELSSDDHRAPDGRLGGRRFGLLTLTPPSAAASAAALDRDLIVLLDTSGSMTGQPLDQGRAVVAALLGSLGDHDRLELITFSDKPARWNAGPVAATLANRADALRWLQGRAAAGGGTELRAAILEAMRPLHAAAQRQVVLVTDGLIGAEREVIAQVLAMLPAGSVLHVVGVGSAVNRSLTGPLARAGRGMELLVGLGEEPSHVARELIARCAQPMATEVKVCGSALVALAAKRIPDVYAGAPLQIAVELKPEGGSLRVSVETPTRPWEQTVEVPPVAAGSGNAAIAALFGRERVEELEMELAAAPGAGLEAELERTGLDFQLATRRTSWLAIRETPSVDPRVPTRRVIVPQELPHGLSANGLGIRGPAYVAPCGVTTLYQRDYDPPGGDVLFQEARVVRQRPAPASRPAPPSRVMEGRVTVASSSLIAVEVLIVGRLDVRPPRYLRLTFADGTQSAARLVVARSTAPGRLEDGQILRLVLEPMDVPWRRLPGGTAKVAMESTPGPDSCIAWMEVRFDGWR